MDSPKNNATTRGAARTTLVWLAAGAAALTAWACTFTVPEGEVAVVARFGDPRRLVEEPGLHFKWPTPIDDVYRIDVRTHLLDPPVSEFLTQDQKNVEIDAYVAWRVADARVFLTSLRDRRGADDRIGQVLQSALNEVLKRGPFDDLVGTDERARSLDAVRSEITDEVARRCEENDYGVAISMVGIERITYPEINKAAVERSMRAKRDGTATLYRAEGNERAATIDSESRAAAEKLVADATEESLKILGQAEGAVKRIEGEALKLDPELYERVRLLEIAEGALRGGLVVYTADHPLVRVFDLVSPIDPPKAAKSGTEGGQ